MTIALPDPGDISAFAIAGFLLLITPGPAVLYIVARSVEQGRLAGIFSVLGIFTGTLMHVTAAVVGLSALLMSSALAFAIVKYVGAGYLIYVGVRRLLSRREPPSGELHLPRRSLWRLYADGFVVNSLNPKTALFFLAFLPQWINPAKGAEPFQLAFLGLLFAVMGLVTDGTYALLAGSAGGWLKRSRSFFKAERYVTGGVFIGLGVSAAMAGDGRK